MDCIAAQPLLPLRADWQRLLVGGGCLLAEAVCWHGVGEEPAAILEHDPAGGVGGAARSRRSGDPNVQTGQEHCHYFEPQV